MEAGFFENMEGYVRKRVIEENTSLEKLSKDLQALFSGEQGFSLRSIKRYCEKYDIRQRGTVDDASLRSIVQEAVHELGSSCGIRPVQGYLRSKGKIVSQQRIANTLKQVNPAASAHRRASMGRSLNPIPYSSDGFGHKFHLDQNEKLVHYGVTVVIMIDGYSRMILSHSVMPVKNNVTIYREVFRPGILNHGLCRQIRTDYGKEFDLIHYVHKTLLNKDSRRTKSSKNMPVERQWVDLNSRVFYPIKRCLIEMEEQSEINLEQSMTKYATSAVSCSLVNIGVQRYIACHNNQHVQGRGKPTQLKDQNSQVQMVELSDIPNVEVALQFAAGEGHHFTYPQCNDDPLAEHPELCDSRTRQFADTISLETVYSDVMRGNRGSFLCAILRWIDLTVNLQTL